MVDSRLSMAGLDWLSDRQGAVASQFSVGDSSAGRPAPAILGQPSSAAVAGVPQGTGMQTLLEIAPEKQEPATLQVHGAHEAARGGDGGDPKKTSVELPPESPWPTEPGAPPAPPKMDASLCMRLYLEKRWRELTDIFRQILIYFDKNTYAETFPLAQSYINRFVETVLYFMTKPDYIVPDDMAPMMVSLQHILANVVAMSPYKTTDISLETILKQQGNFVKLLLLYSPRNTIHIPVKLLFDANAFLASLWYLMYPITLAGMSNETADKNMRRHWLDLDARLQVTDERIAPTYFSCTNVDPERDKIIKAKLNEGIQKQLGQVRLTKKPNRKSIAILTSKWFDGSAVYRSSYPLIETLKERYTLTLVHLGSPINCLETSLFDEVRYVRLNRGQIDVRPLQENDFQLAYFPDIGMSSESIWLSNMRVAPIQVVSYGHPVSTFGSHIDYFLGGIETELPERAKEHYSERLVLIPGLGAHPVFPKYTLRHPQRNDDIIRINCSWGCAKINYPMLKNLKEIQKWSSKPVHIQFFPAWGVGRYNALIPLLRDLGNMFGNTAVLFSNREYDQYMADMERADFSLDSWPFGGYNTIVDSLFLRKPIVTYEGTRFYNRAASALLRRLGLEELVAHNDEEYVQKAIRLVEDVPYRQQLSEYLRGVDLRTKFFDTEEPRYMRMAIDHLIDNHENLSRDHSREPIFIGPAAGLAAELTAARC